MVSCSESKIEEGDIWMACVRWWLALMMAGCAYQCVRAEGADQPQPILLTDRLPFGQPPIDYFASPADDPVASLRRRLEAGETPLRFEPHSGYLRPLLKELQVPVESQLLVFSKTSVNQKLISPRQPRAVYFNDDVSVAWMPGAASLEISAIDPRKGAVFYTLLQTDDEPPRLQRQESCLACHAGASTLQVPGLLVRSFLTDATGEPLTGYSRVTHATELAKRWGGWYVTGQHGTQPHLGNLTSELDAQRRKSDPAYRTNLERLTDECDLTPYLTDRSDIVAHLVFDHQTHLQNLITRVNYECRLNRRSDAEDQLLRYLLCVDEAALAEPISGNSGYREWYERQGPFDSQGRSLRQLDLRTRLFKYRLSPLIYSRAWEGLPEAVRMRLETRLWEILSGDDDAEEFRVIPADERRAVLEMLRDTKPNLPECFRQTEGDLTTKDMK